MEDTRKTELLNTNKIKALITFKNISTEQIAEKLGIMRQTLYKKLNNKSNFNINEIKILSDFLGVSIDYFYTDDL